jgi:pimeloyl-ACP methyl ester carboxylesterase
MSFETPRADGPNPALHATTRYRTVEVEGLRIFYREAGSADAPTLLLLHGFPSSSRMFDVLIPLLARDYHLVAPDYPGFGQSDAPSPASFDYTFDHLERIVDGLTEALGLTAYFLCLQDYGGPVGFRHALRRPERIRGLIIQNAVAHEEGLGPMWVARRAFWRDRAAHEASVLSAFTSLEGARLRHVGSSPNPDRYNPDTWTDEFAMLSRPGQDRIQSDLFHDYRTNVASYPAWQAWLSAHRPPTLVLWGRFDPSFAVEGAAAYARQLPDAQIHLLDAGHFPLDEAADEIAAHMRRFLEAHRPASGRPVHSS